LACGGAAHAQPDVIVGDLYDWADYTVGAPNTNPGGGVTVRAFSVGTYSCNLGNVPLTWIEQTPNYPVITGNMYRLTNGRFQQIGQSWIKHGFCALNNQNAFCTTCTDPAPPGHSCDYLDPGCTDPYSASLNGSQGGLGPKWEINPATGAIPVGAANNEGNSVGGTAATRARIQVLEQDLLVGGLFFTSSTYIHPEDATFGTDNNNQSYRRITMSGTFDGALADTTVKEKPAIYAWREYGGGASGGTGVADNSVTLTPVDVAGDGRFIVGSKVISLGGGNYRYEYAVYNHNSDRAGASFSIPLPAGVTPTNIGFWDVPYHSGEFQGQDGTGTNRSLHDQAFNDWTATVSGSAITWTMPDLYPSSSDDLKENALRWDTIYNFWFEASSPPGGGSATVGLFKAGSPSSVVAAISVPGGSGTVPPVNDACSGPQVITTGSNPVTTGDATTDGPDEPGACTVGSYTQIGNDVWYRWTNGPCAGNATIEICDATFDTKMAVYAACPTGSGQYIACNDDAAGCGTGPNANRGSRVTFPASANASYLVRLGGYNGQTGTGTLNVSAPACAGPVNDVCSGAIFISDGQLITGTTTTATAEAGVAGGCAGASSKDLWYAYRPQTTETVLLSTCGSGFDTVLNVYTACGTTQLVCNDDHQTAGFCGSATASRISTSMTAGTTYLIRVSGYNGASGSFQLRATGGGGVIPPANDTCGQRQGLGLGQQAFTTVGAGTEEASSPTYGQIYNDVWYNHPVTQSGDLTIDTCATAGAWNSKLAVYDGVGCTNLESRLLAHSSNASCGANRASVTIPVTAGTHVTIRIGGEGASDSGPGIVTLTMAGCDSVDFNGDGIFPDNQDVVDFINVFSGGMCPTGTCNDTDFNNDGVFPDNQDIVDFINVFGGSACP
jgi:hypothetical protein